MAYEFDFGGYSGLSQGDAGAYTTPGSNNNYGYYGNPGNYGQYGYYGGGYGGYGGYGGGSTYVPMIKIYDGTYVPASSLFSDSMISKSLAASKQSAYKINGPTVVGSFGQLIAPAVDRLSGDFLGYVNVDSDPSQYVSSGFDNTPYSFDYDQYADLTLGSPQEITTALSSNFEQLVPYYTNQGDFIGYISSGGLSDSFDLEGVPGLDDYSDLPRAGVSPQSIVSVTNIYPTAPTNVIQSLASLAEVLGGDASSIPGILATLETDVYEDDPVDIIAEMEELVRRIKEAEGQPYEGEQTYSVAWASQYATPPSEEAAAAAGDSSKGSAENSYTVGSPEWSAAKAEADKVIQEGANRLYGGEVGAEFNPDLDAGTRELESDEVMDILEEELDEQHPGIANHEINSRLAHEFPELASSVLLGLNDYGDAQDWLKTLEDIGTGTTPSDKFTDFLSWATNRDLDITNPYADAPFNQKKDYLAMIAADGMNNDIDPKLIGKTINTLIEGYSDEAEQEMLREYTHSNNFDWDAEAYAAGRPDKSIWRALTSDEGSTIVGEIAAGAGILGGFLVGGPFGAIAGTGIAPFAVSELKNYVDMEDYRNKAKLQNQGNYPPDVERTIENAFKSIEGDMTSVSVNAKNMSIAEIENAKKMASDKLDDLERMVEENRVPLIVEGTYNKWQNYIKNEKDAIDAYNPKEAVYDPVLGKVIEMPKQSSGDQYLWKQGVPIEVGETPGVTFRNAVTGEEAKNGRIYTYGPGKVTLEALVDGEVIKTKDVSIYDPYDRPTVTITENEIAKELEWKSKSETSGEKLFTIVLADGEEAYVKSNPSQKLDGGTTWDLSRNVGQNDVLVVTGKGKETKEIPLNAWKPGWEQIVPALKDVFATSSESNDKASAGFTGLQPGDHVWINGKEVDPEGLIGYTGRPGTKETISITVKRDGYEPYTTKVYLTPGQKTQIVDLTPTKKEFVPIQPKKSAPFGSGGGRGGGGGGGRSVSGEAMIKFGDTFADMANIIVKLDDARIKPEVGETYALDVGYHSIMAYRKGYKDYSKSVYAIAGETITVNALWEVGKGNYENVLAGEEPDSTPTQDPNVFKVTFSSSPEGAKILIGLYGAQGQSDTGQWTPGSVILRKGLYMLRLYKAGYDSYATPIWIDNICYQGSEALTMASNAGVLY